MNVTASFSMKGKLPSNATNFSVTPVNWRMSDGLNNANGKSQPGTEQIVLATDASSNISAWIVLATFASKKGQGISIETTNQPAYGFLGDAAFDGACKAGTSDALSSVGGTW